MSGEEEHIAYFGDSKWNLCCKQATYLLLKKEELIRLSFKDESALKFHMAICKFCKAFKKQSEIMNRLIKENIVASSVKLADQDKNNLKSLIDRGLNEI